MSTIIFAMKFSPRINATINICNIRFATAINRR